MRIEYVFRHLDQSEFVRNFAQEHVERALSRHHGHPNLNGTIKLEMENSPQHPGKDAFSCEIRIYSPHHGNLIVKKKTPNMYEAITLASDRLAMLLDKVKGRFMSRRRKMDSSYEIGMAANDS